MTRKLLLCGAIASTKLGRIIQLGVDTPRSAIPYLEKITVPFDGFKAINQLSLDISMGELRYDIGPNGADETTLLKYLTDVLPIYSKYFDFAHALADTFMVLSRGEVVSAGVQKDMDSADVKRHLAV